MSALRYAAEYVALSPPTAVTSAATSVAGSTATLNGTTNPNGATDSYYFQYGLTVGYGLVTSTQSAGSGASDVPVTAGVSGLIPGQTYHYRLVAANSAGTTLGADQTFTTTLAPFTIVLTRPF